jgi:hypothetical protein
MRREEGGERREKRPRKTARPSFLTPPSSLLGGGEHE